MIARRRERQIIHAFIDNVYTSLCNLSEEDDSKYSSDPALMEEKRRIRLDRVLKAVSAPTAHIASHITDMRIHHHDGSEKRSESDTKGGGKGKGKRLDHCRGSGSMNDLYAREKPPL